MVKSFGHESDISKMGDFSIFKVKAEEGKKANRIRNQLPVAKTEVNTSSSFLRMKYFSHENSNVSNIINSSKNIQKLKPDSKIQTDTTYIYEWLNSQLENLPSSPSHLPNEKLLSTYQNGFEEVIKIFAKKDKQSAQVLKQIWTNLFETIITDINDIKHDKERKISLLKRYYIKD
mmetsp:Transcript_23709/g.21071  ORF Transcript_23709/g.21071 Transcript_23709/m.21071 type:complete len:175 (-) Transcript_23709:19-543(-)